eukprot:Skav233674  [mRNA]  locus=scaffold1927:30792:35171:- [translate_table: standard]
MALDVADPQHFAVLGCEHQQGVGTSAVATAQARHVRTFSAEEGDPPFQRPPAELGAQKDGCVMMVRLAHAAPSAPPAELRSRFSVQAVAEAEKRRVANEESQERWAVLACQLPKVEDLLQLLKEPSQSGPCQCTHQQLKQVQKLLSEEASAATKFPGTQRGQADGFDFSEMDKLQGDSWGPLAPQQRSASAFGETVASGHRVIRCDRGVQDSEGKDLRHFILEARHFF